MSNYAAGRRREYRCQQILEAAGYQTIRAASSKGFADVIGIGPEGNVRFISVKSGGKYASGVEREQLKALRVNLCSHASVEIWRFPAGVRVPLIEVLK